MQAFNLVAITASCGIRIQQGHRRQIFTFPETRSRSRLGNASATQRDLHGTCPRASIPSRSRCRTLMALLTPRRASHPPQACTCLFHIWPRPICAPPVLAASRVEGVGTRCRKCQHDENEGEGEPIHHPRLETGTYNSKIENIQDSVQAHQSARPIAFIPPELRISPSSSLVTSLSTNPLDCPGPSSTAAHG